MQSAQGRVGATGCGCVGGPRLLPICLDLRLRSQQEEETQRERQRDENKARTQERERGCKTCTLNISSRRCGTGGGWGPAAEWPVAKVMATRAPLRCFSQAGLRAMKQGPITAVSSRTHTYIEQGDTH